MLECSLIQEEDVTVPSVPEFSGLEFGCLTYRISYSQKARNGWLLLVMLFVPIWIPSVACFLICLKFCARQLAACALLMCLIAWFPVALFCLFIIWCLESCFEVKLCAEDDVEHEIWLFRK